MAKISTYPISAQTQGANLIGSESNGDTVQFSYPSTQQSITMLSQDILTQLLEESRPVKLIQSKTSSDTDVSGATVAGGDIVIDPGRAVYITSILVSSDVSGMVYGTFNRSANGAWIGNAIDDSYQVASKGAPISIPVNAIYGEFFRFSMTFRPSESEKDGMGRYPDPNLAIKIFGIEFTNDQYWAATKRLVYTGDSISWSLMGDWRTHDQVQNLSYSSETFPANFGDQLASFRLIKALREQNQEPIRLVNKGFGGSKLIEDQWFALRNGLYSLDWNLFVMQAGVNDASSPQTPLYQLTFKDRAADHVIYRNQRNRSDYPIVFCTTPALDDRANGKNSRNNLDVRPPLSNKSESYDAEFDSGSDGSINLSLDVSANRIFKVSGNDSLGGMTVSGGQRGEIFRVDIWEDTTILTGTIGGAISYGYVRLLENNQYGVNSSQAPVVNGEVSISANTTLYLLCVEPNRQYEEIDRATLVGRELLLSPSPAFDASIPHFIAGDYGSATTIFGPILTNVKQTATSTGVTPATNTVEIAINTGITVNDLPSPNTIDTNDVWVRISGFTDDRASGVQISWNQFNGFRRVVGYTDDGTNLTSITVAFDARQGDTDANPIYRDFRGNRVDTLGSVEILKLRGKTFEFEGTASSDSGNCAVFSNGTRGIDSDNYVCTTQLKSDTGTTFNLTSGKGIVFSLYQEGNTIYMNEVVSGDIANSGYVLGSNTYDNFYTQSEVGMTRVKIINTHLTTVVNSYGSDNCVYLANLYDSSDVIGITETAAGRYKYGTTTVESLTPNVEPTAIRRNVGDLIEDPVFKRVGDSGINECIVGDRLHRSPKGHELIYNRLWSAIGTLTIPD